MLISGWVTIGGKQRKGLKMAKFNEGLLYLGPIEGGYVNDPVDSGGETYRGIARRFHPSWGGWPFIDQLKTTCNTVTELAAAFTKPPPMIEAMVADFYRIKFWEAVGGDHIADQDVANQFFQAGVLFNPVRAIRAMQQALNVLNREGKLFADLQEDGIIGSKTIVAVNTLCMAGDKQILRLAFAVYQAAMCLELAKKDPKKEKYIRGWLTRAMKGLIK